MIDWIFDKGIVIDVFVWVLFVGIEILMIEVWVVIVSVDMWFCYVEVVGLLIDKVEEEGLFGWIEEWGVGFSF